MPKPTLAAINGYCLGGGFEMALGCDLRFASRRRSSGSRRSTSASSPAGAATQRLARLAGLGIAKELVLSGRTLTAATPSRTAS